MNIWKLEWLRLLRTRRIVALLAVFVIFGIVGPLTARYLPDLINNSPQSNTSGIEVIVTAKPKPVDGIAEYMGNVSQLGMLVVVIVAAYSLAIDAKTSLSIFYRTRITKTINLLLPRATTVALAIIGTFAIGTLTAWYETTTLLGHISAKYLLIASLYLCLYWVFCVATVALSASFVKSLPGTVGIALSILIASPIIESFKSLDHWMPSVLSESMKAILMGQHNATFYYRPAAATTAAIVTFFFIAWFRMKTREIEN